MSCTEILNTQFRIISLKLPFLFFVFYCEWLHWQEAVKGCTRSAVQAITITVYYPSIHQSILHHRLSCSQGHDSLSLFIFVSQRHIEVMHYA